MSKEEFTTFMEGEICLLQKQCQKLAGQKAAAQEQGDYEIYMQTGTQFYTRQNKLAYWEEYKARNPGLFAQGLQTDRAGKRGRRHYAKYHSACRYFRPAGSR